jgi:hypothetical protein
MDIPVKDSSKRTEKGFRANNGRPFKYPTILRGKLSLNYSDKYHMKTSILLISLLITISCNQQAPTQVDQTGQSNSSTLTTTTPAPESPNLPYGGRIFEIKKGNHYHSGIMIYFVPRKYHAWQTYFFENTIYESKLKENQADINKLVGFSDCFSLHHKNSARFGWNWDLTNKVMKLHAYSYNNGNRQFAFIKNIPLKTIVNLSLRVEGHQYIFTADGVEVRLPRHCGNSWAWGYKLFPYFGGDETAPHDINIWLKEIY